MNLMLALMAGCFASLGSVCSKFSATFQSDSADLVHRYLLPVLFVGLMILCNVTGLFLFTKSLQEVHSTVVATLTSSACNYILSGLFGMLFFGEMISTYWMVGTAFIVCGLMLISAEEDSTCIKDD